MKKPISYLLLAIVLILGTGCDLFPYMGNEVYFYSMAGPNEEPSSFDLKRRDGGHVIIMSRGVEDVELDYSQALSLKDDTVFTLTLDGEDLARISGSKTVDELGNTGWHVVESFTLPELSKGTYTLVGKTVFGEQEGNPFRQNEVTLEISSLFSF